MERCELTWLGQHGFLLEAAGLRVLIDPFMSEHEGRVYPPPPLELAATEIDWLLVTHEHLDHLDLGFLPRLVERCPEVRLVLPSPIADQVAGLIEAERMTGVLPGDRLDLGGIELEVVPAWHALSSAEASTDGGGRFVGYLLRPRELTLYHPGDTIVTDGLLRALEGKRVDVALLPINGRDFFREQAGIVGNLDAREAVRLAARIGASVLVPTHWDAFAGNTVPPGRTADEAAAAGLAVHVLTLARLVPYRL